MRTIWLGILLAIILGTTAQAQVCGRMATASISTATDTQIVAAVTGASIYICDWEFSSNGTGNIKLEYGTGSSCGTGKTQLGQTWYAVADTGKIAANAVQRGMTVPASNALCVNTSANVVMDVTVYYNQN